MLSIIVPVYKNAVLAEYTLSRLAETLPSDAELILVDDASGLETLEVLNTFKRARIVGHESNRGNTAAYNTGAAAARGDHLVFVDSDVFVPPGALDELLRVLASNDRIGVVGSVLLYP
jgi:glycosyltransferase involved in cell wall biosynthesis